MNIFKLASEFEKLANHPEPKVVNEISTAAGKIRILHSHEGFKPQVVWSGWTSEGTHHKDMAEAIAEGEGILETLEMEGQNEFPEDMFKEDYEDIRGTFASALRTIS